MSLDMAVTWDAWFCNEAWVECSPKRLPADVLSPCSSPGTSSPYGESTPPHTVWEGAAERIDRDPERRACCTSSLMREACPDSDLNGVEGNGVELTGVTAVDSGSLVEA